MAAQALSSLADNALFIAAIALILELHGPDWMAPMMKWWFAASYVLLAAFVGAFADSFPKGRVMFFTNAIKVSGCLLYIETLVPSMIIILRGTLASFLICMIAEEA